MPILPFPGLGRIGRICARTTGSRRAGDGTLRGVTEWHLSHGKGKTRTEVRNRLALRPGQQRQLAALKDEYAIWALGEDALHRAPGPFLVARQLAQRLGPILHDFVRPGQVPAALFRRARRRIQRRAAPVLERTIDSRGENRSSTPKAIVRSVRPTLRIDILRAICLPGKNADDSRNRERSLLLRFECQSDTHPIPAAHLGPLNLIPLNLI